MLPMTFNRKLATGLTAAAIAGIAGAPAASAMPADPLGTPGQPGDAEILAPSSGSSPATRGAGFDLSSAAIGAAAGTGLLVVVLAAGGLAWGRPMTGRHGAARV